METYDYPPTQSAALPSPPPRRSLTDRQKVILGGLGVFLMFAVVGAALNPSIEGEAAAPPLAHENEMLFWRAEAADDMTEIGDTLIGIGESADNGDLSGMQSSCRELGAQAEDALDDHTPTPDKVLTVEMEGALVDLSDASTVCQTINYTSTPAEIQSLVDLLDSATAHLNNATDLLNDVKRAAR